VVLVSIELPGLPTEDVVAGPNVLGAQFADEGCGRPTAETIAPDVVAIDCHAQCCAAEVPVARAVRHHLVTPATDALPKRSPGCPANGRGGG
jgi:hypothetical protein